MGMLDPPAGPRLAAITTRWSLVPRSPTHGNGPPDAQWREFLAVYHRPMVGYAQGLLRRAPASATRALDAEDVVQGFLAVCLEKDWLSRAREGVTSRFRALLQTMLQRWVAREIDRTQAAFRRPPQGSEEVALQDLLDADHAHAATSDVERLFDRDWAQVMVERALEAMRAHRAPSYVAVIEALLRGGEGAGREVRLVGVTPVLKLRATRAFYEEFVKVIGATVGRPDDLPDEWRHLAEYLP